ncbi:MAG: hypothetical protein QOF01_13 [Thermomicrobiales bacterium]|jgi:ferritin-like metal-binding protein YciE|nr:hypothetical protein [Thermomicrobiales bacterium]
MAQQMPMQTPIDLFVHELSDMHSAEQIITQMLGEAQGLVQSPEIKEGLRLHQDQSRQHAQNIEQVFRMLGVQPHPITCYAAVGLRQSLMEVAQSNPSPEVLEGEVLAGAVKTEHLEIAGYTGLIRKAQIMGQTEAAQLLQQNLQQEQQMLQQVEQIGEQKDRQMAAMMSGQMGAQSTQASSPAM